MKLMNAQAGFDKRSEFSGDWLQGWREDYTLYHSLSGARWGSVQSRCNDKGAFQKKQETYKGCENHFNSFNEFVEWSQSEVGYNEVDTMGGKEWFWQLDKDILFRNNKIYSPNTCLFVPQSINKFVSIKKKTNGLPIGVSKRKVNGKYVAQCMTLEGKVKHLGYFTEPLAAHKAWQKAKVNAGYSLADRYKSIHTKLYTALSMWTALIESEYLNDIESII